MDVFGGVASITDCSWEGRHGLLVSADPSPGGWLFRDYHSTSSLSAWVILCTTGSSLLGGHQILGAHHSPSPSSDNQKYPWMLQMSLKAKPSLVLNHRKRQILYTRPPEIRLCPLRTLGASIPHRGLYSQRPVVVSWAALTQHHKQRLKTAGMYSLPVVEAGSLKSRCFKARLPLPSSPLLASGGGQQPWVFLDLWTHHSNFRLCHQGTCSRVSSPLVRIPVPLA